MRTFGLLLVVFGIVGFIYCGDQLAKAPPIPESEIALTAMETMRYPAGRYEAGRYASAALGAVGVILLLLPKTP